MRIPPPPITIASLYSPLNSGKTTFFTSLYCPRSPIVTEALVLSTEMQVANTSAKFSLLSPVKSLI